MGLWKICAADTLNVSNYSMCTLTMAEIWTIFAQKNLTKLMEKCQAKKFLNYHLF